MVDLRLQYSALALRVDHCLFGALKCRTQYLGPGALGICGRDLEGAGSAQQGPDDEGDQKVAHHFTLKTRLPLRGGTV